MMAIQVIGACEINILNSTLNRYGYYFDKKFNLFFSTYEDNSITNGMLAMQELKIAVYHLICFK